MERLIESRRERLHQLEGVVVHFWQVLPVTVRAMASVVQFTRPAVLTAVRG